MSLPLRIHRSIVFGLYFAGWLSLAVGLFFLLHGASNFIPRVPPKDYMVAISGRGDWSFEILAGLSLFLFGATLIIFGWVARILSHQPARPA